MTFDPIRTPWKHQLDALALAKPLRDYALFMEPGTGKTLTSIMIARWKMYQSKRAMRVLVIAPPIVLKNWKEEWLAASKFSSDQVRYTQGTGLKRAEIFTDQTKVAITNYESLLIESVYTAINQWKPEIIIYDEAHRLKNHQAKRTKLAVKLSDQPFVKHRYLLTGTPVLNSPMDLFSQFMTLDLGETFGKNFFVFRGTYFYDKNQFMPPQKHFPDFRIRPGAEEIITRLIEKKSVHVKKSECLDLPPFVRKKIYVPLSPEQKRLYDQMAKDLITYCESGVAVAKLALTKALRLQQIVSGFLSVEDIDGNARLHTVTENPRKAATVELLSDLVQSSKVLVWCCFKQNYRDIREICEKIGVKYVELTGENSQSERNAAISAFQSDDSCRVCIGNAGAGGIGCNLTSAANSIYYSRSFSLEHDIQSEARNYRGGSECHEKITRYDIVAEGTVDELILEKLSSKQAISDRVLNELVLELKSGFSARNGSGNSKVSRDGSGSRPAEKNLFG